MLVSIQIQGRELAMRLQMCARLSPDEAAETVSLWSMLWMLLLSVCELDKSHAGVGGTARGFMSSPAVEVGQLGW